MKLTRRALLQSVPALAVAASAGVKAVAISQMPNGPTKLVWGLNANAVADSRYGRWVVRDILTGLDCTPKMLLSCDTEIGEMISYTPGPDGLPFLEDFETVARTTTMVGPDKIRLVWEPGPEGYTADEALDILCNQYPPVRCPTGLGMRT